MENAIIMASGLGTRMRPLTLTTPKPLIKVCGKPMIETVIEGLMRRDMGKIVITVGYLKEQFGYLTEKYPCTALVENPVFETVNNISSVYAARDILAEGDCFICEADLFIPEPSVFDARLEHSCYFGKMVRGFSDDWVFEQDSNGNVTRIGKNGTDCYNMVGVSYFKSADAKKLKRFIEIAYTRPGYEELFWDEVTNENIDSFELKLHPVESGQIVEIDTVDELRAINEKYSSAEKI